MIGGVYSLVSNTLFENFTKPHLLHNAVSVLVNGAGLCSAKD